jgi:enoyl-CoA hydratase
MTASGAAAVSCTISDGVARIVLDGKPTRNALDQRSAAELVAACATIDADPSVGVATIAGAHGTFCSGAVRDVLAGLAGEPAHVAYEELGALYQAFQHVGQLKVPTIAVIEGAAVGAGLNLALAADLRIAVDDAPLVSGFAQVGIHPGGGHFYLIARLAGREAAAAMGMFARPLTGRDAKAKGLVWDAVPAADLDDAVAAACWSLRSDPSLARAIKASLNLTTPGLDAWATATEVERARQLWSLTRPRPTRPS